MVAPIFCCETKERYLSLMEDKLKELSARVLEHKNKKPLVRDGEATDVGLETPNFQFTINTPGWNTLFSVTVPDDTVIGVPGWFYCGQIDAETGELLTDMPIGLTEIKAEAGSCLIKKWNLQYLCSMTEKYRIFQPDCQVIFAPGTTFTFYGYFTRPGVYITGPILLVAEPRGKSQTGEAIDC